MDSYNEGYTHEVLHMSSFLASSWETEIVDSRCCEKFPELMEKAKIIANLLGDFYQAVGKLHFQNLHKIEDTSY